MKIRVAQTAIAGTSGIARTLDDVIAGCALPWVELDGHRITDFASIDFAVGKDTIGTTVVQLELLGPLEIVYVDHDGNELGSVQHPNPAELGKLDYRSIVERP